MSTTGTQNGDELTSRWPLPESGVRFLVPPFLVELLRTHPLSRDLYPLAFGFYPRARGHEMRRRSHVTELLIYCSEGIGHLEVDGQQRQVQAGDIVLLPAGVEHAYAADAVDPWSPYWLHYSGELSADYAKYLQAERRVVSVPPHPRIVNDFQDLLSLRRASLAAETFIHGANRVRLLLTGLAEMIVSDQRGGKLLDLDYLVKVMHRHIDQELDLTALASEANLSKYHFIRRFKALTGHTPIQYFIHLKLQYACYLLDTSHLPVKNIARRVGYEDQYYFSRLFKQSMGLSPQHYRHYRNA